MWYIIGGMIVLALIIWYVVVAINIPMMVIPIGIALVVVGISYLICFASTSDGKKARILSSVESKFAREIENARKKDAEIVQDNERKERQARQRNQERADSIVARNTPELARLRAELRECEARISAVNIIGERFKNAKVVDYLIGKLEDNLVGSAREGLNKYEQEQKEELDIIEGEFYAEQEREKREQEEFEKLLADARAWDKQNEIIRNQEKIIKELKDRK